MLRTRAAAVSAATAAIALSWAAPANSVVTPATESHPKQPATASPEVVATGQSECDKPTQVRAGAWACPSQPTTSVAAAAGTSGHGFCTYQGCWSVIDSVRTTHKSTITYGYGKTKLGTGTFYFKTTASGGRNVSDWFYFTSTRGTRSTKLEAERLYLSSAYPGGNRISPPSTSMQPAGREEHTSSAGFHRAEQSPTTIVSLGTPSSTRPRGRTPHRPTQGAGSSWRNR